MRTFQVGAIGLVLLFVVGLVGVAAAEPLAREDVPAPLAEWVDWALRGHEDAGCPTLAGQAKSHVCAWPSKLVLELGLREGRFTQRWLLHREATVPLPGDGKYWPQDVGANGGALVVATVGDRPHVRLPAGEHTVSGRFLWDGPPELLQIPPATALIELTLHGSPVRFPSRDAQGRLWLQQRDADEPQSQERLEVRAHRKLVDDIPLQLETQLELRVSGRAREVLLGRALPDGFAPIALISPFPARLDPDGRLRVQVRPGVWNLSILARDTVRAESIALPDPGGSWDASEEWVFEARPQLRIATLENGISVDPNQTTLPPAWRHLPAYQMTPGHAIQLVEERRGDSDPAPDQLSLSRELWLDFDGGGYTATDRVSGVIRRSSRLETATGLELGRVAIGGRDQVITRVSDDAPTGIEVARGPLELVADSRLTAGSTLAAVGWDHDFSAAAVHLNLPPGWRLFHASGVDSAATTWLERWTLLDFFAVLVLAAAFQRLWGNRWGALALVALAITWTEPGAPHWAWVAALVGVAVLRALPAGRFERFVKLYRAAAFSVLVLIAIPFVVSQVRAGLFPTLGSPEFASHGTAAFPTSPAMDEADFARLERGAPELAQESVDQLRSLGYDGAQEYSGFSPKNAAAPPRKSRGYAPDPDARITTGPGRPVWDWTTVDLAWSGPVGRDEQIRLVLVPPFANRVLSFLRVGTLAALVMCLLGSLSGGPGALLRKLQRGAPHAAALLIAFAVAQPSRADIPSKELLDELRTRLLEAPSCSPKCATSPRLSLEVSPAALRARIQVDALVDTAIPLPGGVRSWSPSRVTIDDQPAPALLRRTDGTLWIQVDAGRHQIVAEGDLPERDTVELPLPMRPHRVTFESDGWTVSGVHENGIAEATLQLTRIRAAGEDEEPELEAGALPPFVRVVRAIRLGLEWSVQTSVLRVSPAESALVIEIPLLAGESLTTEAVRTANGNALVNMPPGSQRVDWSSTLEHADTLALTANAKPGVAEIWRLDASPVWHVTGEGIPPIHDERPAGAREREWRPWPGETLTFRVDRPAGVAGATATIDRSELNLEPGLRATDAQLAVTLRSSSGGQHEFTMPEAAELQEVKVDGAVQPIRQEGRSVRVALRPGSQNVELSWREPRGGAQFVYRGSAVDVGIENVNSNVNISPLRGRWTLFAGGPRLGPAVLFWPLLAVFGAIAFALGRVCARDDWVPLRFVHWFLLSIGLSQVPVPLAALVVAWLLTLGWRRRHGTEVPGQWFNLMQVALAGFSFVALLVLFYAIQQGLLGQPEMQIAGNNSESYLLRWYQDRSSTLLPQPWVLSVPLLIYRVAMLAWALWLASMMMNWLRWGWECFAEGELWRPRVRRAKAD